MDRAVLHDEIEVPCRIGQQADVLQRMPSTGNTGTQWTQGFTGNGTKDTFLAGLYGNDRQDKVYADAVLGYG